MRSLGIIETKATPTNDSLNPPLSHSLSKSALIHSFIHSNNNAHLLAAANGQRWPQVDRDTARLLSKQQIYSHSLTFERRLARARTERGLQQRPGEQ